MPTIAHLTSVHPRTDPRIFLKQCVSLARAGYDVHLIVADGQGPEVRHGVNVHDVGCPAGRWDRMQTTPGRLLRQAREIDASLCHLHDPELLTIVRPLHRLGKQVIFDSHEDVPLQLLSKPYLPGLAARALSVGFAHYQRWVGRHLNAVVAATPHIRDTFRDLGVECVTVHNYPLPDEFPAGEPDWSRKNNEVCYIGGITRIRGIREMLEAMALTRSGARLQLAGRFSESDTRAEAVGHPGWPHVDDHGWLDRAGVQSALQRAVAGLVLLHPTPNHIEALPTKLFEYMAAGIPVIASDFPLWREIVLGNRCGFCVDPMDPAAIARAIDFCVLNRDQAREMGANGRRAVWEHYNWLNEEKSLRHLYANLLRVDRPDTSALHRQAGVPYE